MIRELLFELYPRDLNIWLLRMAIIPVFFMVVAWLTHIVWGFFEDKELVAPIRRRITINKSLILTILFLNTYWFFIVRFNGCDMFSWATFTYDLRNVYFALVPLTTTYILLIYWFYANNLRIKNQL